MITIDPSILEHLVGTDDQPGILDHYKIVTIEARDPGAKPLIIWRCERDSGGDGNGYVGIIARNMEMDQTNLTVGELVDAVLRHGDEEHGGDTRPDPMPS
jgi:hypothetical protein